MWWPHLHTCTYVGSVGAKGQKGEHGYIGQQGQKGQNGVVGQKGQRGDQGQKGQKGESTLRFIVTSPPIRTTRPPRPTVYPWHYPRCKIP